MLLLSETTDPIIDGLAFFVLIILLSIAFVVFCKGWRRFFAICFIILGIFMYFRTVHLQRVFDERMSQILKASENFVRTNTPATLSETNSNK
jgi:hypothetical protein